MNMTPQLPALTWPLLRDLIAEADRSPAWAAAGRWAIDRLSAQLGEEWPANTLEKYSHVPGGMALAPWHTVAFAELLELALRLELLQDCPRFVPLRQALRTDAREEQVAHLRVQLEVAALALRSGCPVEFEPPIPGGEKRGDAMIEFDGSEPMVVETRAVLPDARTVAINDFTDELFPMITMIASRHGAACHGSISKVLDEQTSAELLDEIDARARLVGAGMVAPPLRLYGVELTLSRFREGGGTGLRGPRIGGNGWPRIAARLQQKAEQTKGARHVWLRFDIRDGLWQFSQWAQGDLATKGQQLAAPVIETLRPYAHVSGVVMSSGALLAQGEFSEEECVSEQGVVALRRLIYPLRVRETLVLPIDDAPTSRHADAWHAFYEEEPTWLDWGLGQVGLPDTAKIFAAAEPGAT